MSPPAPLPSGPIAVLSPLALSIPYLAAFLPGREIVGPIGAATAPVWAAWGNKLPARLGSSLAGVLRRGFIRLEDGFLRSVGLGKAGAEPYSIVVDDLGMYFDARRPSRLERLIAEAGPDDAVEGGAIRRRVVAERLSKYNAQPDRPIDLGPRRGRRILLVDQVSGDQSIAGALADGTTFQRMVDTARREHPDADLLLRQHPDVVAGYRRGHLAADLAGARLIGDAVEPQAILDAVDEVWTVSSQIGFEALMRGLPVTTFGMPFYAGWGLTRDLAHGPAADAARRRRSVAGGVGLDALTAAALIRYPRYADPATGQPIDAGTAIDRLTALRRRMRGPA